MFRSMTTTETGEIDAVMDVQMYLSYLSDIFE